MEQKTENEQQEIWITYKDDDGQLKSAPLEVFEQIAQKKGWKKSTNEQLEMGLFVSAYLEKLGVHQIAIAEAVSDDNYKKSHQLIKKNPKITKQEFLEIMQIEEK